MTTGARNHQERERERERDVDDFWFYEICSCPDLFRWRRSMALTLYFCLGAYLLSNGENKTRQIDSTTKLKIKFHRFRAVVDDFWFDSIISAHFHFIEKYKRIKNVLNIWIYVTKFFQIFLSSFFFSSLYTKNWILLKVFIFGEKLLIFKRFGILRFTHMNFWVFFTKSLRELKRRWKVTCKSVHGSLTFNSQR